MEKIIENKGRLFSENDELSRSPLFSLKEEKSCQGEAGFYFVHASGRRVETDEIGALIWHGLPSTSARIIDRLVSSLEKGEESIRGNDDSLTRAQGETNFFWKPRTQEDAIYKNNNKRASENDNLSFLAETYLYVLYRAGIIFCNGQSALENGNNEYKIQSNAHEKKTEKELTGWEPLVSVVIITHNGEKFIRTCLNSLRQQRWPRQEIIVVDNASEDGTLSIIKEEFPEVRLYSFDRNRHFAAAVNLGLKKSRGKAILVLNQDISLHRNCLTSLMLKYKEENGKEEGKVAAVVPLMKFIDLRGFVNGLGNHIRSWGWGSDNFIGAVDIGQFGQLKLVPSACFGAVLLSAEAVATIGYLDEGYRSFYEDIDWSFRAWLGGWKIVACPEAIVYHHFGGSYREEKKFYFVVKNRLRLVLKIFSGKTRLRFLYNYIIEDFRCLASSIRKKRWKLFFIYIKSYFCLLLSLPDIWLKRKLFLKGKIKEKTVKDVLALNPERWSFLNSQNEPIINMALVQNYYLPYLKACLR